MLAIESEVYDPARRAKITPQRLREIALGAAAGLQHIAQEHLIHRDIAARNILIDAAGFVRISDFGMSRTASNEGGEGKTVSSVGVCSPFCLNSVFNLL